MFKKWKLLRFYIKTLKKHTQDIKNHFIENSNNYTYQIKDMNYDRVFRFYTVINMPPNTTEEIYTDLEEDIIEFFNERYNNNFTFPVNLKFYFQKNVKLKQLIKLTKIPDQYSVIIGKDILVQVNPDYFDSFSSDEDEINAILFDQCIDLIKVNPLDGSFKIGKTNFHATTGIIEKFTYDKVQKAIEMERLYEEQKNDQDS
jgi:hypothetical protein